jgi:uncharacterized protein (DUF2141 family)
MRTSGPTSARRFIGLVVVALTVAIPAVLVAALGVTRAEEGGTASLRVQVKGVRSDSGVVRVLLFDGPEGYPTEPGKALRTRASPISKGEVVVVFEGLGAGTYALFAFHDEDGNGKLRSNFIGMPKEGVGASNNAKGRAGPPSFKAASVEVTGGERSVSFSLRYL